MTFRLDYLLYATTVFLSSFLLFAVQPLLGKHILPWFGGSAAIWITAMFFFMVALAVGYLYALLLSVCPRLVAVVTHVCVLLSSGVLLWRHAGDWPSAITPLLEQVPVLSFDGPALVVCVTLALSIGLPFVLLSSTSSLLQYWYGATTRREPFSLYAISNAGSLCGLLSYPFVFEPFFSTYEQGSLWSLGFWLYVGLLAAVMVVVVRAGTKAGAALTTPVLPPPSRKQFFVWMALASVPVAAMVTATSYISGYIAPIPFLWIVPLVLYLLSFMVSFRGGARLPHFLTYALVVITTTTTLVVLFIGKAPISISLVLVFAALFSVCHLCHEILYHSRPITNYLTQFYLALSFGGIFGSTLVLVSSLFILPVPLEFFIIISATSIIGGYLLLYNLAPKEQRFSFRPRVIFWCLVLLVIGSLGGELYGKTRDLIAIERNFFGYKAVYERTSDEFGARRSLIHGTTNHGSQFLSAELAGVPIAYYGPSSGVGRAITALRRDTDTPLKVALAGLGVGTLAAYCQEGDNFDFFEIDPEVIDLAREHFTYLERCPQAAVQLGDARLLLEAEYNRGERGKYDLIVIDAYADDMVPVHLMTAEAVALYKELLTDDGIIAIHISSRYLDLSGVVSGLAIANDLAGRHHFDFTNPQYALSSYWALLGKKEGVFDVPELVRMPPLSDFKPIFWTDTYSALYPVVELW